MVQYETDDMKESTSSPRMVMSFSSQRPSPMMYSIVVARRWMDLQSWTLTEEENDSDLREKVFLVHPPPSRKFLLRSYGSITDTGSIPTYTSWAKLLSFAFPREQ